MGQPLQHRTIEEKLALLDSHPLFTGACPKCNYKFPRTELLAEEFVCPACGWNDK